MYAPYAAGLYCNSKYGAQWPLILGVCPTSMVFSTEKLTPFPRSIGGPVRYQRGNLLVDGAGL